MSAAGPWTVSAVAALDGSSGGAQVAYAAASAVNANIPAAEFTAAGSFSNVAPGQYVVIRVVSENGENTGYYKVRLVFGDVTATLNAITIDGTPIVTLPEPNSVADGDSAARVQMSGPGPWTSVSVGVTQDSDKSTVRYASAPAVNANIAEGAWSDSGTLSSSISSGQYVFIRVTSEAGTANYYKLRLVYGSGEANLSSVTVGGVNATVGSSGIFDPATGGSYTGFAGAVTLTSDQAGDGSSVTVAAVPSADATVRYNWGGAMSFMPGMAFYYLSDAANWNTTGQGLFGGGSAAGFISVDPGVNGAVVFIEVTSQDGTTVNTYAVSCTVSE
jgi:hypothetical protein